MSFIFVTVTCNGFGKHEQMMSCRLGRQIRKHISLFNMEDLLQQSYLSLALEITNVSQNAFVRKWGCGA